MTDAAKSRSKKILSRSCHAEFIEIKSNLQLVVEGGSQIYVVKLERSESFFDVMNKYSLLLENSRPCMKFHNVFDGYSSSTKDLCHRQGNPVAGTPLHFDETTVFFNEQV